jgi:hypothetical protein
MVYPDVVMNSSEIDDLFARTLAGDYDSDAAWEPVHTLRSNGNREIFDRAAEWCRSEDPFKRARGADILCQLRPPRTKENVSYTVPIFRDESFLLVTAMLKSESADLVLSSGIFALGHLGDIAAVSIILRYLDHPDEEVRYAVTFALGCFPNEPKSIAGLLKLTTDSDDDVRDWATFGLGVQSEADSPEIREALLQRLTDPNEEVREEAAIGLGKRRELRLLPVILEMLDQPILKERVAEAASALLGLEQDPPEWEASDYKVALKSHSSLRD